MVQSAYRQDETGRKSLGNGYVFGAPVRDFGIFATVLLGLAIGLMAFLLATFAGIVVLMVSGKMADLSLAYRHAGVPAGIVTVVAVWAYLGTFWVKRVFRKG